MKKYKRKSANLLLAVFSAILLFSFSYSQETQFEETEEITVVHKHEFSGEAPGNVSRSFVDQIGFQNRTFQDFISQTLQEFHSKLSYVSYTVANHTLSEFKAPIKVYKLFQRFLI